MNVRYYADTDTLYIELRLGDVAETRDLDENTLVAFDAAGHLCAITVEHVRERAAVPHFAFGHLAA